MKILDKNSRPIHIGDHVICDSDRSSTRVVVLAFKKTTRRVYMRKRKRYKHVGAYYVVVKNPRLSRRCNHYSSNVTVIK